MNLRNDLVSLWICREDRWLLMAADGSAADRPHCLINVALKDTTTEDVLIFLPGDASKAGEPLGR